MSFKERIKSRRLELGLTTDEVAKLVGVSNATISRWETGVISNQRRDKIEKLALALQTTAAALLGEDELSAIPNIQPMFATHRVPRLGTIACGEPILAAQNPDSYDDVPDFVHCDFTLTCQGDSMINARIHDGDIVCIRQQDDVEDGEIAAVLIEDSATLKRVRKHGDSVSFEAENPLYRPIVVWAGEAVAVRILGKATYFISAVK